MRTVSNEFRHHQIRLTHSFAALREQATLQHQPMLQLIDKWESDAGAQLCHLSSSVRTQIAAMSVSPSDQPVPILITTPEISKPAITTPEIPKPPITTPELPKPAITTPPPLLSITIPKPPQALTTQSTVNTDYSSALKHPLKSSSSTQHSTTRVHSQRTQPYNTTARRHRPTQPSTTHPELTKKPVPTPPVAFLSDSTLKAVVEDESTQSAMIANNWEKNLLFRGRTAAEITSLAKNQLVQLKSEGVKKFILSIGTNDLLQLPQTSIQPKQAAETAAATVSSSCLERSPSINVILSHCHVTAHAECSH